jgi:sterol desaturase/sphingolipid hydroxylase (fatty acid hydroxylase superfamily)
LKIGFWSDREYHLDRMNLKELTIAYFQYYAIVAYIFVAIVSAIFVVVSVKLDGVILPGVIASALCTILLYPLIWYLLHRWVLHSKWMWRSVLTASVWKRIHYDHHSDPNNLQVLFGALYTTLPTVVIATVPIGYTLAGWPGAIMALCVGVLQTCFYEYMHCIQHLGYVPNWSWVKRIKKLHMAHHFHNETGNFGITNFFWDRFLKTMYEKMSQRPRSKTVFNLGYDEEVAKDYPYVAALTENWPHTANPLERKREYSRAHDGSATSLS